MFSELHSLNLKLCSKQDNRYFVLHLIVAPQLSSGWRHICSTKTILVGSANEQSMNYLMFTAKSQLTMPSLMSWPLAVTVALA
jgi:hypothetical protein